MIFIKSLLCQLNEAAMSADQGDLKGPLQAALISLQSDLLLSLEASLAEEIDSYSLGDLHRFDKEMFQLVWYVRELPTNVKTPTLVVTLFIGKEAQMFKIRVRL